MSRGADFETQVAVVTALSASTALKALIGTTPRLYQDVPEAPTFPYVWIGPSQVLPDRADCIDGSEIFFDLHAYSEGKGYSEVKNIAAVIVSILNDASLTITGHSCVDIYLNDERTFIDEGNLIKHSVLTFRALVEPTA
jgi:hypothetical protein